MKAMTAIAATAFALVASGCARGGAPAQITKLDCPDSESGLKRVDASADGKRCDYVSTDGAVITLKLVPVTGSVDATLEAVEADLRANLAAAPAAASPSADGPADPAAAHSEAAAVRAQAEADARRSRDDDVSVKVSVDADGDWNAPDKPSGERARIDLPGVQIMAEDEKANIRIGPLHIDANSDGAVIRMQRDVRLRGESLSRKKRGVSATFILAGEDLPGGHHFAGYEAGGPRTGPLVVAVVKGRSGDHEDIYGGVKKLVRRNAGI